MSVRERLETHLPLWRRVDWVLLLVVTLILALGFVYLSSTAGSLSSQATGSGGRVSLAEVLRSPLLKQGAFLALGLSALVLVAGVDYRHFLRYGYHFYVVVLALLGGLFLAGVRVNGARSWYSLAGAFQLQPSEFMKVAFLLALASYFRDRPAPARLVELAVPLLLWGLPVLLILQQPDLGTALVFLPVPFAMLYAAGAKKKHLALVAGVGALLFLLGWCSLFKGYQKRRVQAWLNPEKYELREAYQLTMSTIAIGSGRLWGKGYGKGTFHQLRLLPERRTDFIFGVIAEEGGFVTCVALLGLYYLLVLSALFTACSCRDPAGRLIAVGVAALLGGQALINIAVCTGLLPTTGITLPLVSYGGSSLLSSFIALGLLVSVGGHTRESLRADRE